MSAQPYNFDRHAPKGDALYGAKLTPYEICYLIERGQMKDGRKLSDQEIEYVQIYERLPDRLIAKCSMHRMTDPRQSSEVPVLTEEEKEKLARGSCSREIWEKLRIILETPDPVPRGQSPKKRGTSPGRR